MKPSLNTLLLYFFRYFVNVVECSGTFPLDYDLVLLPISVPVQYFSVSCLSANYGVCKVTIEFWLPYIQNYIEKSKFWVQ